MTSSFAKQVVEAEKRHASGRPATILVGNLDAVRDLTDVRDVVRAYWLAAEGGQPGEVYNICSGIGFSVREVLEILLGLSGVPVTVSTESTRFRPADVPRLIGDPSKAARELRWKAEIPIRQTLADLLDYWRQRL